MCEGEDRDGCQSLLGITGWGKHRTHSSSSPSEGASPTGTWILDVWPLRIHFCGFVALGYGGPRKQIHWPTRGILPGEMSGCPHKDAWANVHTHPTLGTDQMSLNKCIDQQIVRSRSGLPPTDEKEQVTETQAVKESQQSAL